MKQIVEIPRAFKELFNPWRYKIFWGGRGGCKSWSFARALIVLSSMKSLRILCTREYQNSISDSVHHLLDLQIGLLKLRHQFKVRNTYITGPGDTEFIFKGIARNVEEIKSTESVDICWIEEADKVSENSWDIIIPTIRKPGSEIWASFNTRYKHDATYRRFITNPPPEIYEGKPYALVRKVGHQDNPFFTKEMQIEMEILKEQDYEKYLHVWEGELRQLAEGAIFGKQFLAAKGADPSRICNVPIIEGAEIHTFWDLGHNDHTSIWFMQNVGPEYRFVDFYQNRLQPLAHYIQVLKGADVDSSREENERRGGYNYGTHYLPHDVEHKLLGMTRTRRQQLEDGGLKNLHVVPRIRHKNEAIEMARQVFSQCWFDKVRCEEGLDSLANYRYEYNEDRDAYQQTPHHDWASNGADAFMQFAQAFDPTAGWAGARKAESPVVSERRRKAIATNRGSRSTREYGLG